MISKVCEVISSESLVNICNIGYTGDRYFDLTLRIAEMLTASKDNKQCGWVDKIMKGNEEKYKFLNKGA